MHVFHARCFVRTEAERLQQRAERRSGLEALPAYEKAVVSLHVTSYYLAQDLSAYNIQIICILLVQAAFKVALGQTPLTDSQASTRPDQDVLEGWLCLVRQEIMVDVRTYQLGYPTHLHRMGFVGCGGPALYRTTFSVCTTRAMDCRQSAIRTGATAFRARFPLWLKAS